MRIEVDLQRPRWLRKPATWKARIALAGVALLTVAVPAAWASHQFADVPTAHQFHSQISAIAGAGITTGCGGGNYCPDDNVRRDAMAAFMHRGFGRVGEAAWLGVTVPTSYDFIDGVANTTVTTGVASTALPGSNGFVSVTAGVQINRASASGCPCQYDADLYVAGEGYITQSATYDLTITAAGSYHIPMTGTAAVGAGAKKILVLVRGPAGATTEGYATVLYVPFGPGGTDVGSTSSPGESKPQP